MEKANRSKSSKTQKPGKESKATATEKPKAVRSATRATKTSSVTEEARAAKTAPAAVMSLRPPAREERWLRDPSTLARFKKILLEERQRVLNSSRTSQDDFSLSTDDMADETDHAVSALSQNLALTLKDRERTLLASIDAALQRIETGTFGMCSSCEEPIESKRLEARAVTTLCFSCQEAEEHRRKIFA